MSYLPNNDVLDDTLNSISNLPLDTTHFHKQVKQLDRQINLCKVKLKKLYKRILNKQKIEITTRRIKKYHEKIRSYYSDRFTAFEYLENAVRKLKYEIQTKLYPLRNELELDIIAPVEEVKSVFEAETLYCFCKEKSHGDMVRCDAGGCEVGWFHFNCVGLTSAPRGLWFCDKCKK